MYQNLNLTSLKNCENIEFVETSPLTFRTRFRFRSEFNHCLSFGSLDLGDAESPEFCRPRSGVAVGSSAPRPGSSPVAWRLKRTRGDLS